MSRQFPNETAVLAAVRRFLKAAPAGSDAKEAMALLISETSRIGLGNLDDWERILRAELWSVAQSHSSSQWKLWKKPVSFASWLDLCNGDGFKRERILRSLSSAAPNGFLFSLAVRRLNDWVPEVRAAAREHLPLIAELSDPDVVVDALWNTLPHWASWGRMEELNRLVLIDFIRLEAVSLALKVRIMRATAGPATAILAQAGRMHTLDKWLLDLARGAIQPSVRAKSYRSLLEGRMTWLTGHKWSWTDVKWCKGRFEPVLGERPLRDGEPFLTVLKMALIDRSPLVRCIAADQFLLHSESVGEDALVIAEALAADPSPYIAERGRFWLSRSSGTK